MEREISSSTKLGIVLLALSAVIGLSFAVFMIMKTTANDGVSQQQDVTTQFEEMTINGFNDKVVKGREILSFMNTAKREEYAVLINTTKMNTDNVVSKDIDRYVHVIENKVYINLCSVIVNSDDVNNSVITERGSAVSNLDDSYFELDDGVYYTNKAFNLDSNGRIVSDYALHNLQKDSTIEYISENSNFNAHLIKDGAGVTIGICVEQINI